MTAEARIIFSALKFVSGDSEHICRLCFSSTENEEVSFEDYAKVHNVCIDETLSFMDMLDILGVPLEPLLPQVLCLECANSVINAYLFCKLCQHSNEKWIKVCERFQESLTQSEQIHASRKTAYIMFHDKESIIFTSRIKYPCKTTALTRIEKVLRGRTRLARRKKTQIVENELSDAETHSTTTLKKHEKKQDNDKSNDRIPCKQCAKYFASVQLMREHEERVHFPKTIHCGKCGKMFGTKRMLHRHDNLHHVAAICPLCFVQFPSKNDLRAHLDKHELNNCGKCNKKFKNKVTYKIHLKMCGMVEARVPNFFCDFCNKGFMRKNSIRTHLKINHGFGKVLTCDWCNKRFDAESTLKCHIVKHTRERNFNCTQCGNVFVTKAALVCHTRLHTGEKPYPCDMCEESFLSASRRMEHKRRKHLKKTKQCLYCNVKFVTTFELKKHTARHTNPKSKLYVPLEPYDKTLPEVDESYMMKFLS